MTAIPVGINTQEEVVAALRESIRRKNACIERCRQKLSEMRSALQTVEA